MTNADIEKAQRIAFLLSAVAKGELSIEETEELKRWRTRHEANEAIYQQLLDKEGLKVIFDGWEADKAELALNRLQAKVSKRANILLWKRIAAAAAVVAIAVSLLYLFSGDWFRYTKPQVQFGAGTADIAPGKHAATLSLANGKTIALSSVYAGMIVSAGNLRYTDGTAIDSPVRAMETLVAKTPMGGTYQFTLPDGSQVWLNAASSITFPASFEKGKRRVVEITGEAYFEVAKVYSLHGGERIPFMVKSGKQELEVLGTHFNLNAYKDEPVITTTLLEGSVRVSSAALSSGNAIVEKGSILKPNQQAVFGTSGIKVADTDPDMAVAWKNGYFKFEEESIQSIMRKLAKWYDIDVLYEPGLPQQKFTGRISRFKHISQVLKLMSAGKSVRFKVEGRRVTVIR